MTDNWGYWRRYAYARLLEAGVSPNEARSFSWTIAEEIRKSNEQATANT